MTPLELSICLHYHSSCEDMPWVLGNAPIRDEVIGRLTLSGMLVHVSDLEPDGFEVARPNKRYYATKKLHSFVEMLCNTPLPVQQWVDPRDNSVVRPT